MIFSNITAEACRALIQIVFDQFPSLDPKSLEASGREPFGSLSLDEYAHTPNETAHLSYIHQSALLVSAIPVYLLNLRVFLYLLCDFSSE